MKKKYIVVLIAVIGVGLVFLLSNSTEYFKGSLRNITVSTKGKTLKQNAAAVSDSVDHKRPTVKDLYAKRVAEFPNTRSNFSTLIDSLRAKIKTELMTQDQKTKLVSLINLAEKILKSPNYKGFVDNRSEFLKKLRSLQGKYSKSINELLKRLLDLVIKSFPLGQNNSGAPILPRASRQYNVAVCVPKWSADINVNPNEIRNIIGEVDAYYNEISFGQVRFVLSTLSMPQDVYQGDLPADVIAETGLAVEMCDRDINFSSTDIFVVFPSVNAGRGLAGNSNDPPVQTEEGQYNRARVWIGHYDQNNGFISHLTVEEESLGRDVLAHEIGHALFNIRHSNALECYSNSYNHNFQGCESVEYGNSFELMSSYSPGGHISAWYKLLAGEWVNSRSIQTAGTYLLSMLELPADNRNPQLLRITSSEIPVCLDYRKPIGADSTYSQQNLAGKGIQGGLPDQGCLFVYLCTGNNFVWNYGNYTTAMPNTSFLLDASPNSQPDRNSQNLTAAQNANIDDMWDSCLQEGTTYRNESLNVGISYTAVDDKTINVRVDMP